MCVLNSGLKNYNRIGSALVFRTTMFPFAFVHFFFMVLALQLPGAAPGIKDEVLVIFRGSLENN